MNDDYLKGLDAKQLQAHDLGFLHLSEEDANRILKCTQEEFNEQYKHYYHMGISKNRLVCLEMYYDKSIENISSLKQYMQQFNIIEYVEEKNSKKPQHVEEINTTDLIEQLKGDR